MNVGQKINELIGEKGVSVKHLAEKIGVAPTTLYSVINRDSNRMDVDLLIKIAHELGTTADDLIGNSDIPVTKESLTLTPHEIEVIIAYRKHPEQQNSVDKLLDVSTVAKNVQVENKTA